MKQFRSFITCFLLFAGCYAGKVQAQYFQDSMATKGFDKQKLFTGGNLGLSLGSITYINVSPLIGYRFSDLFAAGVQINSQYESVRYKNPDNSLYKKERYTVLGGGIFGRLYPLRQFFLQLQPEMNFIFGKVRYYDGTPEQKYRDHVASLLGGGGYSQAIGDNSAFVIMVLYDILQDDRSPYGNKPVFRAGVNIGF